MVAWLVHSSLLPRWAESFYYGYGSPVFHYYMGLVYATVSLLGRVLGLDMLQPSFVVLLRRTGSPRAAEDERP